MKRSISNIETAMYTYTCISLVTHTYLFSASNVGKRRKEKATLHQSLKHSWNFCSKSNKWERNAERGTIQKFVIITRTSSNDVRLFFFHTNGQRDAYKGIIFLVVGNFQSLSTIYVCASDVRLLTRAACTFMYSRCYRLLHVKAPADRDRRGCSTANAQSLINSACFSCYMHGGFVIIVCESE